MSADRTAKQVLAQLKRTRRDRIPQDLRLIEEAAPEIYADARRFFELAGDVPWEAVIVSLEGEARELVDKYGIHFSRSTPRYPDVSEVAELFCEVCDLLWLQRFPQD